MLYPRNGSWTVFVQELQSVSPVLAYRLADDPVGNAIANDPLLNPYCEGDLAELVVYLTAQAAKHDAIVLGYCLGEAMRRVRVLPPAVRQKVIVVHGDAIPRRDLDELSALGTLGARTRSMLVTWLVDRIVPLGEGSDEVIETLELDLADEGVGLGV